MSRAEDESWLDHREAHSFDVNSSKRALISVLCTWLAWVESLVELACVLGSGIEGVPLFQRGNDHGTWLDDHLPRSILKSMSYHILLTLLLGSWVETFTADRPHRRLASHEKCWHLECICVIATIITSTCLLPTASEAEVGIST